MTEKDRQKLIGVSPIVIDRMTRVFAAMASLGFPLMVTDGLRTMEHQRRLYAQGRTTPGPIVTNCDGVVKKSNHQARADGFGHAVDAAFVVNGKPSWAVELPWDAYGACVEAVGLQWGGRFKMRDCPHAEDVE